MEVLDALSNKLSVRLLDAALDDASSQVLPVSRVMEVGEEGMR